MKTLLICLCAALLTGCAANGDFARYVETQERLALRAMQNQRPLVEIKAREGEAITGLESVTVYAPNAAAASQIQQARPNEWAAVADRALGVVGQGLGLKLGGAAAIGLAREVGQVVGHGYQFVNPTPVTVIAPDPVIVPVPDPIIVFPPDPVIIPAPDPIIVQPTQ